jgi:O-antigen/teichoic acid export membrane protein
VAEIKQRPSIKSFMQPKKLWAGLGWNTAGQFLVIAINLALTPFLLHHLGATLYGVFALASSTRGMLSNLDGGLAPAGYRYFPIYVGREDAAETTSFLFTMLTLVVIVVGSVATAMILIAPAVVGVFAHGSGLSGYSHETVQLIRFLMPAMFLAAIRTPIQRLVMAHHRWAFLNYTGIIAQVAFSVTAIGFSLATSGLQCLIWATYVQEAVLSITAVCACRQYISLKGLRWLPISEVREIVRFGLQVQIAAIASSFNYEIDSLIVAFLFPAKDIAYYGIGANFAQQMQLIPLNGLNPITQDIGRNFGKSGKEGVLHSFSYTQQLWVTALGIFPVVAALEGWFGIRIWLGPGSQVAAATAAILVIGNSPLQLNSIVDIIAKVIGMPEIESWYLGIGVALNVACTIPLALRLGVIGVPLGTGIGQVLSFVVCIYLARKKIGRQITSFFRYISYVPVLVASAVATVCVGGLSSSLPTGAIGLVFSGLLVVPACLIYYGWLYGEPLLLRFGIRARPEQVQTREIGKVDSTYADRQLKGLQALIALAEPDTTARQLRGLQVLMALAEPDTTVVPFSGDARLRYTGPLQQAYWRPLEPPTKARVAGRASRK